MTREEAITYLKVIWNRYKAEYEIERETLDAYHMAIEALRHDVIFEQIKWERDVALDTLEKHGIGLGQKYEPSTDAEEEVLHKILERGMIELPQEYASVVRCKDCRHRVFTKDGESNPHDIVCDYHMSDGFDETDFCSYGERREP